MITTHDVFTVNKTVNNPKAVVMLFGWLGAQPRYLNKYAELYHDACWTVAGTADKVSIMTADARKLDRFAFEAVQIASQLIRKAEDGSKKKIPVIIHAFSNGGAFIVERLEKLLAKNTKEQKDLFQIKERLSGEVFDSAPAYLHVSAALEVIGTAIPNPIVRLLACVSLFAFIGICIFVNTIRRRPSHPEQYWSYMCNSTTVERQAVIYSEADTMTDSSKLDEFIDMRRGGNWV